ncbi:hypothetical protein F7725_021818 [Dissostichus mawsoni]|uniref:Uncharacterized protein n=1 Tax=Dissostichus mawsoni TaxID=36200 RepID=A0A7J5ZEJ2_DISMA|nr:hypothetical protein F7725_021818 [Dissostichus mawsoni]
MKERSLEEEEDGGSSITDLEAVLTSKLEDHLSPASGRVCGVKDLKGHKAKLDSCVEAIRNILHSEFPELIPRQGLTRCPPTNRKPSITQSGLLDPVLGQLSGHSSQYTGTEPLSFGEKTQKSRVGSGEMRRAVPELSRVNLQAAAHILYLTPPRRPTTTVSDDDLSSSLARLLHRQRRAEALLVLPQALALFESILLHDLMGHRTSVGGDMEKEDLKISSDGAGLLFTNLPHGNNTSDIAEVPIPGDPCSPIKSRFRCTCMEGYVRKAGTSNLLICNQADGQSLIWTRLDPKFECILDPNRTTAPPKSTATTGHTHVHIPNESTVSSTSSDQPEYTAVSPPECRATSSSTFSSAAPPGSSQGTVDSMPGTKASTSHRTLSTTTEASYNGTITPGMFSSTAPRLVIGCASLVIFCALVGISFFFYKRRSRNESPRQTDEQIPMKMDPRD